MDQICTLTGKPCVEYVFDNLTNPMDCPCGDRVRKWQQQGCTVNPVSSRMCELGTKGCTKIHTQGTQNGEKDNG